MPQVVAGDEAVRSRAIQGTGVVGVAPPVFVDAEPVIVEFDLSAALPAEVFFYANVSGGIRGDIKRFEFFDTDGITTSGFSLPDAEYYQRMYFSSARPPFSDGRFLLRMSGESRYGAAPCFRLAAPGTFEPTSPCFGPIAVR